jgi:UDP-3-O-[3-hydroxymyristoyl] glucosamine N-acyltransferase
MPTALAQLAQIVGGVLRGDGTLPIHGAAILDDAQAGQITLVDGVERLRDLKASCASAAVVPRGFAADTALSTIEVDDVHWAFATIVKSFRPPRQSPRVGISPLAHIRASARLAEDVDVYPGASIGDDVEIGRGATIHSGVHVMAACRIAHDVTIMPGAVLYEETRVGPRVIIHAGAVIGAYGFGYTMVEGRYQRAAQLGYVEIGADVEIGAGTTIDRGTYGPTVIGEGTKIDNLVMIAHNCRVGRHNMICSQVGIAGSTTTGDYVVMAGQVGVRDHVHIGTRAVLGAKAGVSNDVPDGARMIGIPATPERVQKLKQAALAKLPEMRQDLKALERRVAEWMLRIGANGENDGEMDRDSAT